MYVLTLVRTDVSEERIASIIRVKRINELGTTLAINSLILDRGDTFLRNVGSYKSAKFLRNVGSYKSRTA
jgi:hypothetical protein